MKIKQSSSLLRSRFLDVTQRSGGALRDSFFFLGGGEHCMTALRDIPPIKKKKAVEETSTVLAACNNRHTCSLMNQQAIVTAS